MGIIDRAQSVVASNFNALLSRLEEPGRDLAQTLSEMREQLNRAQRELIATVGEAKREEAREVALREEIERWEKRAELAVRVGDDKLAREALSQKRRLLEEQRQGGLRRAEGLSRAAAMKAQLERMKQLYQGYTQRQHTTATQVAHARAGGRIENLGQLGPESPFERLERIESAVEGAEAEVAAQAEVDALLDSTALGTTTKTELEAQFRDLEATAQQSASQSSREAATDGGGALEPAPSNQPQEQRVRIRVEP